MSAIFSHCFSCPSCNRQTDPEKYCKEGKRLHREVVERNKRMAAALNNTTLTPDPKPTESDGEG